MVVQLKNKKIIGISNNSFGFTVPKAYIQNKLLSKDKNYLIEIKEVEHESS
jgi:hypothetical protein